jgi:hypothetical protein
LNCGSNLAELIPSIRIARRARLKDQQEPRLYGKSKNERKLEDRSYQRENKTYLWSDPCALKADKINARK